LHANVIDTDQFLAARRLPYLDNLDHGRLRQLVGFYRGARGPILVAGVEMLDTLLRLGTKPDVLVYVKHLDSKRRWKDEDECNSRTLGGPPKVLPEEIAQYHAKFRPQDRAEFIYLRIENGESLTS